MYTKLAIAGAVAFVAGCLAWFFGIRIALFYIGLIALPVLSPSLPFATMCTVVGAGAAFVAMRILQFFIGRRRLIPILGYFALFNIVLISGGIAKTLRFQASHKNQYDEFLAIHSPTGVQEGICRLAGTG